MAQRRFIFDAPDAFVAGTVGEPGSRSFYLQAREGSARVTVEIEKVQVAALAQRMLELLDVVHATAEEASTDVDAAQLEEPLQAAFRVGAMSLAWDPVRHTVVIEAQPLIEGEEQADTPADDPTDLLRVRLAAATARDFVEHAMALVAAGRPLCPFCGEPLEPTGHFCPRTQAHLN